jgi:hypothetical protein
VEILQPYIVRVSTPGLTGTGFFLRRLKNPARTVPFIATAAHVVEHAREWEEPIRIYHPTSGKSALVRESDRFIVTDSDRDTAAIFVGEIDIPFPEQELPLGPEKMYLKIGNDIGWLGFPAIADGPLSFFGGRVSAWLTAQEGYLVDGVVINGVSGGPAFHIEGRIPVVIGVVSAYIPNRASGTALPGLGMIRGVNHYHELIARFEEGTKSEPDENAKQDAVTKAD